MTNINCRFAKENVRGMNQEEYCNEQETIELLDEEKSLLLIKDDVNTFDYVIETLIKVCHHTYEQAETCALITHCNGKCPVMSGSYEELKPYHTSLLNHHLYAKIQ